MKKIDFKKILILSLIIMFILTSCNSNKDSGSDNKNVTLKIFQFKVEFRKAFEKAANLYKQENPNVDIQIITVGGGQDYGASLRSKFSSGDAPTIFNIGGPQDVKTWKSKLADLSDTRCAKEAVNGTLDAVKMDKKIYGLPYNIEGYGLIYNKVVFENAGINPGSIKTFNDLKNAVQQLDAKKGDLKIDAVFALPAQEKWVTGLHLSNPYFAEEFNEDIIKTYKAKKIDFKYAREMKNMLDLQNKYSIQPSVSTDYSSQVEKYFSVGRVAMIQQGNWAYNTIEAVDPKFAQDGIGLLPFPVEGIKEDCYPVGVPNYWCINKDENKETQKAAKDFLDWLYLSNNGKKIVTNDFKFIPAYKNYDKNQIKDPLSKQLLEATDNQKTIKWVLMGYPEGWGINQLGADIQQYLNGALTWDKLVENAKKTWAEDRQRQ